MSEQSDGVFTLHTLNMEGSGYTQTPLLLTDVDQASEDFYSFDNQIYININKSLSRKGKAEAGAHEMLGHGYFYYLFKDKNVNVNPSHIIMNTFDGFTEGNIQLMMQILGRMGETQINYENNNSKEK